MNQAFSRVRLADLLVIVLIFSCTSLAQGQEGAATYKAKCIACHGADGSGSSTGRQMGAPDLASDDVQKQTDTQLAEVIAKGKGRMPAYEGKLDEPEIKDLVGYIRRLGKK